MADVSATRNCPNDDDEVRHPHQASNGGGEHYEKSSIASMPVTLPGFRGSVSNVSGKFWVLSIPAKFVPANVGRIWS